MQSTVKNDTVKDRWLDSLEAVIKAFNLRPDMQGLLLSIPREKGSFDIKNALHILDKLDLHHHEGKATPSEIRKSSLPALVLDADGIPHAFLPKSPDKFAIPDSDLQLNCYFVFPDDEKSWSETSHMVYGHTLDWFWSPLQRFSGYYRQVMLCSFFINLFVLAFPLFSMNVYDRVSVNFSQSTLAVLTVGVLMVLAFDFMFKTLRGNILENIASKVGTHYDSLLMERLIAIKMQDMILSVGERANIFRELQGIRDFYAAKLAPTIVDMPFFLLFLCAIYMMSPVLTLVPIAASAILLGANVLLQVPLNKATKSYFLGMQSKSSFLFQMLAGLRTIKMMNAGGTKLFEWQLQSLQSAEQAHRNHFYNSLFNNFNIMVTYLVSVAVLYIGMHLIADGNLTVGGLVASSMLASRAVGPVINLTTVISQYKRSRDVLISVDKIFKLPCDTEAKTTAGRTISGALKLEEVAYQYQGQLYPALTGINLNIKSGERVGFIGRSGAGKSTLTKLVCSLLEPSSGSILLDNFAMSSYSPSEVRRNIGYVPQDSYYFSGSIENNILLGHELTSKEDMDNAIRISGMDTVMQNTGRGLDMDVGENGDKLSGGQKQSIALARAIVRNPKILVFDEPTNGIDSSLEAHIRTQLADYTKDRTFLLITHRTSLLSLVDRLVLLERGKIIADGPRDEILKKLGMNPG